MREISKAARLVHDPKVCAGCGVCEVMCSLYHEGVQGSASARSHIVRQPFTAEHSHNTCQQCFSPSCYFACPLKDKAVCIDQTTGTAYVDENECTGCGMCVAACPFDPPRININVRKNVASKCDLCREREGGPICVEYCPFQALKIVSKDRGN
jgi:Fe-S-cluster-containing hydrogenase component 2